MLPDRVEQTVAKLDGTNRKPHTLIMIFQISLDMFVLFGNSFGCLETVLDVLFWSQVSASSLNPSFFLVHKSIRAFLITKPPSVNAVQTEYSGVVVGQELFCKSSTTDKKLGKPGILSLFSLASEKTLLLVISSTKLAS